MEIKNNAILLLSCKDQKGLVSKITNFNYEKDGNIIYLAEHVDAAESMFFVRIAWSFIESNTERNKLREDFSILANEFNASWEINLEDQKQNVVIFVS